MVNRIKIIFKKCAHKVFNYFGIYLVKLSKEKFNEFIKCLKIYSTGYQLIRIGNKYEGGYLIPNLNYDNSFICVSLGVGAITSFEDDLHHQYKIKSYLYDGSIKYTGQHTFHNLFVKSFNQKNGITLNEILSKYNKKIILQMDIESDEYEVILSTNEELLDKIDVLVIEFHNLNYVQSEPFLEIAIETLKKLNKFFDIVHIHPNNQGAETKFNDLFLPNLLEITFLNKKHCIEKNKILSLPHNLDYKNFKNKKDIILDKKIYI